MAVYSQVLALLGLLLPFLSIPGAVAQVTLTVRINSGNSSTTCTDGFLGGAPEPHWRVSVAGNAYVTYPSAGICYVNPPNTQYSRVINCAANYPATLQVCFRAFEDDGSACTVSESCLAQACNNFATPSPGSSVTHTLSATGSSSGSVNFTISATGSFLTPSVSINQTPITCPGGTNGALAAAVSGGVGPFTYLWNTGSTNASISGLAMGAYSVTVTDQTSLCVASANTNLPDGIAPSGVALTSITGATTYCTQGGWLNFYEPGTKRLIASVNPNGQNLGAISVDLNVVGSDRQKQTAQLLRRSWVITPSIQPSSPVSVRLYYTASERTALNFYSGAWKWYKYNAGSIPSDPLLWSNQESNYSLLSSTETALGGDWYTQFDVTSFSGFIATTSGGLGTDVPFPVELLRFEANWANENGNTATLEWETVSETNCIGFDIERALEQADNSYSVLGFLPSEANAQMGAFYTWDDTVAPAVQRIFYRLRQLDYDGTNTVFGPIELYRSGPDPAPGRLSFRAFPNPACGLLNVAADGNGPFQYALMDATGRALRTGASTQPQFSLNVEALPAGVYLIHVTNAAGLGGVQRVVVQ